MKGILADINTQGHLQILLHIWRSAAWCDFWDRLGLAVLSLADLGLSSRTPDCDVWHLCQERELVLFTANRNADGPESLEATLRQHNTPQSLPVFTLANATRFMHDAGYANQVAEALLDYLMEIDRVRGTGRLFVP